MSDNEGVEIVNNLLKHHFKKDSNYLSTNITLATNDGSTIQIDLILINEYGIFVIETQHCSGWIFGTETDSQWTQTYNTGLKLQFLNPLLQNENQIKQLRQYLPDIPEKTFKSIIVFTGTAELETAAISNVIKAENLVDYLKQFKETLLTLSEIEVSIGKIEFRRKEQFETTHAEPIESGQNQTTDKETEQTAEMEFMPQKRVSLKKIQPQFAEAQADIEKEYTEYKEKLNQNQSTDFEAEKPARNDFILVMVIILIIAGTLGFLGFLAWEKTFPEPQAKPPVVLIKPQIVEIKKTDPHEISRQKMQERFRRNAEENQKQKQKRKVIEKKVKKNDLEQFYAEIARRKMEENKKEAFNQYYKPRAECSDPLLEWSKTVRCVNEKITAREKFYENYESQVIRTSVESVNEPPPAN